MARLVKANLSNISASIPKVNYNARGNIIQAIVDAINKPNFDYTNINYDEFVQKIENIGDYILGGNSISIFDHNLMEEPSSNNQNNSSKPYGKLNMNDYPRNVYDKNGNYDQEAAKARAVLVAKYLVNEGGFTKEQAAAMAGVFWDENQCNPGEVMPEEYQANRNSYGAGIASWTDQSFKNQCLKDAGYPQNTPIESLTMEQQCYMLVAMSNGSQKRYYDALKRCNNIEDASATAVCITGGIGFSSHWSTHPTQAEAHALAEAYAERNDKKYHVYSDYHHNLDKRRLQRAKEIYAEL